MTIIVLVIDADSQKFLAFVLTTVELNSPCYLLLGAATGHLFIPIKFQFKRLYTIYHTLALLLLW